MMMFVASDTLATLVGKAPLSRRDVFDIVSAYMEAHGLFSKNKMTFKPDRKLASILGLGAPSSVSWFDLPNLVNKQLQRATAPIPRGKRATKATTVKTKVSAPAHARTRDELLGAAVDFDGAQIFVVTDLENARAWRGTANGKGDAAAGSDWAAGFAALYGHPPDEDHEVDAAAVAGRTAKPAVDLIAFGDAGWVHVFGGSPSLALVDGTYDDEHQVRSRAGTKESVPTQAEFTKYVASPPAPKAKRLHSIKITSGWLLAMSATASFAKLKPKKDVARTKLDGVDVVQVDDDLGGRALLVRMPKGRYDLIAEPERKGKWGSAKRVLVVPA